MISSKRHVVTLMSIELLCPLLVTAYLAVEPPYHNPLQRVYMFSMALGRVLIQVKKHADPNRAHINRFLLSSFRRHG